MWVVRYKNAYVLTVKYHDCTNFEGMKIMVYRGQYTAVPKTLDPHFTKGKKSPIARFPPTVEGIAMAKALAKSLR
jgi:hypothetical protein